MSEIKAALRVIEARKKALRDELDQLQKAEEALRPLAGSSEQAPPPTRKPRKARSRRGKGLKAAVIAAVAEIGPAPTAQIIDHIRANRIPDANRNSVRSTLSVTAKNGEIRKQGENWRMPREGDSDGLISG